MLRNSVAEAGYVRLGGIDQWVLIRGENVANPPLIVLHGDPGMSEMGFFRHFNAPLERHSRSFIGISAAPASRSLATFRDRR